jgi:phytoene/squalene synthetase
MNKATASLAREITRASSRQSYYTACLLVDKDLVDDCCRAYGYFRWVDDAIDLSTQSKDERISFVERQRGLIERLYRDERPGDLCPEEEIVADLISNDRGEDSGLQSFIRNFLAILEFDAHRKGALISGEELRWYADCLGVAVTDAILYFVGNDHTYPETPSRYLAATAAHITHMLRDLVVDLDEGYFNVPREYLRAHNINPEDFESPAYREWVRERVELARTYFREGKRYLDGLDVLRCKIAGYWYCVRFECVLDAIEKDGYILWVEYSERRKFSIRIKLVRLALSLTLQHVFRQARLVYKAILDGLGHRKQEFKN